MRFFSLFLIGLFILAAGQAQAKPPVFPALSGRIVDQAGLLRTDTVHMLDQKLAAHEKATGEQIVVVTLKDLGGQAIEEYGYRLGRHWGIGQKGKNNGALLIVVPDEKLVRIEVGYGLEGRMTDALSSLIIQRAILPEFRTGDFDKGVTQGVTVMLSVLGGTEMPPQLQKQLAQAPEKRGVSPGSIIILLLMLYFLTRSRRRGGRGSLLAPLVFGTMLGRSGGGFGGGVTFGGGGGSFGGGGASGRW